MPITRVLHLSDLRNCGSSAPPAPVRGAAWEELLDAVSEVGIVDLVALTGDVSATGRSEEFSALTPFLERTCARLGVPLDRLFVVPGDRDGAHDLTLAEERRLIALARRDPTGVSSWIAGRGPPPPDADATWCAAICARQRAFWGWLTEELHQPERRTVGALGYHARIPISGSQAHVEVYGLNSSWMSSRCAPADAALLGHEQVAALVRDATGAPRHGLRLALVHHPPAALVDAEACVRVLAGAVDLLLCGHGAHPRFTSLAGGARLLAAGPIGDEPATASSCQLIQIETDAAGRPIGYSARIWTWFAAEVRWRNDAPEVSAARRGRLYWSGTAPAAARSTPRGIRLWTFEALLAQMFASTDELRKWMYMRAPEIYPELPGGKASVSDLAFAAHELLAHRGLLDDELLDALADFSPAYGPAVVEFSEHRTTAVAVAVPTPAPKFASPAPESSPPPILKQQPRQAQEHRENLRVAGLDAMAIEAEFLGLRRQLHQGPASGPGDLLANGRYVLQRVLGRGGFSTVWRARDVVEGRDVAVKILHPQDAQDPARRERFFRGARAMQQLTHPAVVRVLSPCGGERPQPFFVMELIEGSNLHEAVIGGRRPKLADIVAITCTIGQALSEAHRAGMVHRDVKPANILLDRHGSALLTDFDLVRARDTTGGTRTGGMGTVLYAAPELIQNAADADARADIYGLGMTMLFMLFGKDLPYKDIVRNPETILDHVVCPAATKGVVLKAIAWDREHRFADMASFCTALRGTQGAPPVRSVPASTSPRAKERTSVGGWVLGIVAFVMVSTVVVHGMLYSGVVSPPESAAVGPVAVPTPILVAAPDVPSVLPEPESGESSGTTGTSPAVLLDPNPSTEPKAAAKPYSKRGSGEVKGTPPGPETPPSQQPIPEGTPTADEVRQQSQAAFQKKLETAGVDQGRKCREKEHKVSADEPLTADESIEVDVVVRPDGSVVAKSIGDAAGTSLADCMAKWVEGQESSAFSGEPLHFTQKFII